MLHIVPAKRPTAAQILRHPWLWQQHLHAAEHRPQLHTAAQVPLKDVTEIKGAVNATFRAISSPQSAHLGPVAMSALARRRQRHGESGGGLNKLNIN